MIAFLAKLPLLPNEREAKIIRHVFQRFVELGSSTMLVKGLKLDGVISKSWTTQNGKVREGKLIDKSLIYKVLNNRTYLGELRHKEQSYQAEHSSSEHEMWDKVHAILATNGPVRSNDTRAKLPYLLKSIVFGSNGRALSHHGTRLRKMAAATALTFRNGMPRSTLVHLNFRA
ncbi:recombinase family protein [Nitrosomonas communis]|uniref:Recombinase n=1 Tax=Nitrosomonas communis TaxID=44574 RepID=A0A1I4UBI8_9PROT|nr:recombinase family protein [Nitrosomonas communis]SFM86063.1 Recombinase [Nitrosomonas communis]